MDTNETKIYIAILIAALALAVLIIFFTVTIVRHHRRSLRLYQEKVAAEITTLENERRRIASDLHDDLGPLISAIKLQVSALDAGSESDEHLVKKIGGHLDTVVDKLRTTSNGLVPLVLIRKGFQTALEQYVASINETGQLHISLQSDTISSMETNTALHLFRMIQEMITNTIKHGKASLCAIRVSDEPQRVVVQVRDDGVGFNFQKLSRSSLGFGLQNILSRAEILHAKIFIDAKPSGGVCYTVELPKSTTHETVS